MNTRHIILNMAVKGAKYAAQKAAPVARKIIFPPGMDYRWACLATGAGAAVYGLGTAGAGYVRGDLRGADVAKNMFKGGLTGYFVGTGFYFLGKNQELSAATSLVMTGLVGRLFGKHGRSPVKAKVMADSQKVQQSTGMRMRTV